MSVTGRSYGLQLLARTGCTHEQIAARIDCSRSLAGHWLAGRRVPTERWRDALRDEFKIPVDAWDRAPPKPKRAPAPAAPSSRDATPPASPAPEITVTSVREAAARLQQKVHEKLEKIDTDPMLMPLEWFKCAASAAAMLNLLGKLTGQTQEVNEGRILRLPAWQRIQDTIITAATPWPDALRAIGEALTRMGAEL
ncbi:MAG TPA: hypothetical protein VF765_31165 [Polyangiaceae bacterium]